MSVKCSALSRSAISGRRSMRKCKRSTASRKRNLMNWFRTWKGCDVYCLATRTLLLFHYPTIQFSVSRYKSRDFHVSSVYVKQYGAFEARLASFEHRQHVDAQCFLSRPRPNPPFMALHFPSEECPAHRLPTTHTAQLHGLQTTRALPFPVL